MSQLEELCTSCARCCRGLVPLGAHIAFGATTLDPDEEQRFNCRALPQPCPMLDGELRCSIYATRPKACVKYLCPTAAALERGELTFEQARAQLG